MHIKGYYLYVHGLDGTLTEAERREVVLESIPCPDWQRRYVVAVHLLISVKELSTDAANELCKDWVKASLVRVL